MPKEIDRLFVKFDDHDRVSSEEMTCFAKLNFPNKVFFTGEKENLKQECAVYIPSPKGRVPDGLQLSRISPYHFNSAAWIAGRPKPSSLFLSFV